MKGRKCSEKEGKERLEWVTNLAIIKNTRRQTARGRVMGQVVLGCDSFDG